MSAKVTSSDKVENLFPDTPIRKIITPMERLMKVETTGGIVLIIMTVAALLWANLSPESYHHVWHLPFALTIGSWVGAADLHWFINDALMTIFFFNIGLEVKGEIAYGELHDPKAASSYANGITEDDIKDMSALIPAGSTATVNGMNKDGESRRLPISPSW